MLFAIGSLRAARPVSISPSVRRSTHRRPSGLKHTPRRRQDLQAMWRLPARVPVRSIRAPRENRFRPECKCADHPPAPHGEPTQPNVEDD